MRLNTTLMTTAALVGLLATTPVLAQDNTAADTDGVVEETMPADETVPVETPDATLDAEAGVGADVAAEVDPAAGATVDADAAVAAEVDMTADATAMMTPPEGFVAADLTTFTVDQLLGTDIYGSNADGVEFIGNVTDLVLADDQAVSEIITDVGGFLGIGQKSVAIPAASFVLFSDADGNLQGHVAMTREEIEALPEYVPPVQ